jgi:hypothetical protein
VNKVRGHELRNERWQHVGEQDDAFGDGTDEVLGGGEDDDIEDIINEA